MTHCFDNLLFEVMLESLSIRFFLIMYEVRDPFSYLDAFCILFSSRDKAGAAEPLFGEWTEGIARLED
jgi:hypothetical protein